MSFSWNNLPRPFFVQAPMYDVTDAPFRRIIAKYGKPDVLVTEFVACDGLISIARGKLMRELWFDPQIERPIVAQIWGAHVESFEPVARLCRELGFDGVDINMGCPEASVLKQRACAALIDDPVRAREIVAATREGAGDLPVSVKTRIGLRRVDTKRWMEDLVKAKPAAITVHGRTAHEMSKVPAHWDEIAAAVEIIHGAGIVAIGNGDVGSLSDGRARASATGVDGVMIGRGIFGNPWLYAEYVPSSRERILVAIEHTKLYDELLGPDGEGVKKGFLPKNFSVMKKHYKAYVNGWIGAKELRGRLMETTTAKEAVVLLEEALDGLFSE